LDENNFRKNNLIINNKLHRTLYIFLISFLIVCFYTPVLFAGDVILSWEAPIINTDGTPLTDLEKYIIHIGISPDYYTQHLDVGNVTTYVVSELVYDSTYYFAVTAVDTSGNKSEYSNQVSRTINSSTSTPNPEITINDSVAPVDDLNVPFGDITEFNSSDHRVTVKNDGNAELVIGDITQVDQLSTPFSTFNDTCSWQNVTPTETCSFTVRFSPTTTGYFTNIINIPSNDLNETIIAVALSGTGLSSSTNNPPSRPRPKSPKNKGKGHGKKVTFKWEKSSDPDGDTVSYQLNICEDPNLITGCIMETNILSATSQDIYYAGIGSFSIGLLFFGIGIIFPFNREGCPRIPLFVATIAVTGMFFLISCGRDGIQGSDNSNSSQEEVSQEVSGLSSGTTYYWQVVAKDGKGGETNSSVWSFETQ
jgi:hypothetical protein